MIKNIFFAMLFLMLSHKVFVTKTYYARGGLIDFEMFNLYIPVSILCLLVSLSFFYLAFRPKTHIKPYIDPDKGVKCPKCKKSYNYKDTNKGKCPTCNIDTIDIDDYYKKFPKELKDAGK